MFDFNDQLVTSFSAEQMIPVINCYLAFVIQEEISLRSNANQGLLRAIDRIGQVCGPTCNATGGEALAFRGLIHDVILPFIRKGVRSSLEVSREELIGLLAHTVKNFPEDPRSVFVALVVSNM